MQVLWISAFVAVGIMHNPLVYPRGDTFFSPAEGCSKDPDAFRFFATKSIIQ